MQRSYSIRITALTLGVSPKWLDNVLSHHRIPGVSSVRQGVERSISDEGLLRLEMIRIAAIDLGISVRRAVAIAETAFGQGDKAYYVSASGATLHFPLESMARRLRERLVDAIEAAPRVPRGRPRKHQ